MSKILKHPDKEEIISRLNDGESIRKTYAWLKEKYPNNKKLWISTVSLQKFRKDNLQLDGKVLKDIQEAAEVQQRAIDEQQRQAQLEATSAYQDKINEIANTHLDVSRRILELDTIIGDRIEYWYNAIKSGDAIPQQGDKQIQQFMDRQMNLLGQYKKFVEGMADKTVEHNVNITVMNEQISLIRDVIRDVIQEFNPDIATLFIEKLNKKLDNLEYSQQLPEKINPNNLQTIEAEVLSAEDLDD